MKSWNGGCRMVQVAMLALASACASLAPPGSTPPQAAIVDASRAPPLDPTAKRRLANREPGDKERRLPNARYEREIEADEAGPPRAAQIFRAHAQRAALELPARTLQKAAGIQSSQWQSLGPSNVAGRVRSMAIDPANGQRILAGTASGGLWMSENGGATWRANSDFLPNLSISAIAFDAAHPSTVYAGTGEASAGLVGVGVFRSLDGGNTWTYLDATSTDRNLDWRFVNRIAVDPRDSQVLLAGVTNENGVTGGIYRSADAGATWSRVSDTVAADIAFDPHDGGRALAGALDGTVLYSRDAGLSWQASRLATSDSRARAEIAYAPSQPGVAYASLDVNKGEVWRSPDGGVTWARVSNPQHLASQGDYDNAIWVDPTDANHVLVAGLDIHESRDGGATFNRVSDWTNSPASPHADHHVLVSPPDFGPSHPALYNGNDGGVYRADNVYALASGTVGLGWSNLNAGLAVTQFYSGASRTAAGGRVIGGSQDNGSLQLAGGQWSAFRGGDGGYVAVDPTDDRIFYGEYVYLAIHRSLAGGASSYICNGITEGMSSENGNAYCGASATRKANFIAPFILDPNNRDRLLAGANSLWVTDNARGAVTWRAIKPPSAAADNFINAIAVQEGNAASIWVGHNNGELYRTTDGLATAPSWTRMGAGTLPSRRVMRILTDPANAQHVIVAFTGFVANNLWETTDGGGTWHTLTGNLPFAPIFDVKRHPRNPAWLYAATSVGLFTSEDAGATWSTTNEGPANIRIRELFWIDDATLGAATYGRGMFKVSVGSASVPDYQDLWWGGSAENGWGMSIVQHGSRMFAALFVYDAAGKPVWVVMPGGTWSADGRSITGDLYAPTSTWYGDYDASRFAVGNPVGSATITFAGPGSATLAYTINGASGVKAIQRQPFGVLDRTPGGNYGDMWWGGASQNGWGVAINQQYRTLFAIWYTYDASGRATWYVIPGGSWSANNVFTGTAYRTTSSGWVGLPYDAASLAATAAGTVTFTFTDADHAVMDYAVDGVVGHKAIGRQAF